MSCIVTIWITSCIGKPTGYSSQSSQCSPGDSFIWVILCQDSLEDKVVPVHYLSDVFQKKSLTSWFWHKGNKTKLRTVKIYILISASPDKGEKLIGEAIKRKPTLKISSHLKGRFSEGGERDKERIFHLLSSPHMASTWEAGPGQNQERGPLSTLAGSWIHSRASRLQPSLKIQNQ